MKYGITQARPSAQGLHRASSNLISTSHSPEPFMHPVHTPILRGRTAAVPSSNTIQIPATFLKLQTYGLQPAYFLDFMVEKARRTSAPMSPSNSCGTTSRSKTFALMHIPTNWLSC